MIRLDEDKGISSWIRHQIKMSSRLLQHIPNVQQEMYASGVVLIIMKDNHIVLECYSSLDNKIHFTRFNEY